MGFSREIYRECGGIGFAEECGMSEIAEIESPLVVENEERIVKLVLEN